MGIKRKKRTTTHIHARKHDGVCHVCGQPANRDFKTVAYNSDKVLVCPAHFNKSVMTLATA